MKLILNIAVISKFTQCMYLTEVYNLSTTLLVKFTQVRRRDLPPVRRYVLSGHRRTYPTTDPCIVGDHFSIALSIFSRVSFLVFLNSVFISLCLLVSDLQVVFSLLYGLLIEMCLSQITDIRLHYILIWNSFITSTVHVIFSPPCRHHISAAPRFFSGLWSQPSCYYHGKVLRLHASSAT